jgi:predicted RNA-binding protein YlqC (UPF0109 family)
MVNDPKVLLEFIVKALVDHPEDINIKSVDGEKTSIIELKVHNDDIGKVIGKEGRIAMAMRTLLSAVSSKAGKRVKLEILD